MEHTFTETDSRSLPPILSVIVPTRNRFKYVTSAIRSVLACPDPALELVIADNSDSPELGGWIDQNLDDPRVRYAHFGLPVSMSENYDRGMRYATGEYICFIGDDDGVNPEVVAAAAWARAMGFDALVCSRPAQYWWPDLRFRYYGDSLSGSIELAPFTGRLSFPNAQEEMRKCVRRAGQDFGDLPRVYYGIVKREVLNQVKALAGTCFPGPSPDMASSIAVAAFVKSMCHVDYPLFLPGSSGGSMAGLGAMKRHIGRLEEQRHLPAQSLADWSELVPRFFSGNTVWGEDLVAALRAVGCSDVLREFNVPLLHAMCLVFHPQYARVTLPSLYRALRSLDRNPVAGTLQLVVAYFYTWGLRFESLLRRLWNNASKSGSELVRGVPDVERAVRVLIEKLSKAEKTFNRCVEGFSGDESLPEQPTSDPDRGAER